MMENIIKLVAAIIMTISYVVFTHCNGMEVSGICLALIIVCLTIITGDLNIRQES